jgi:predicted MFS family arabinose efflux permease
VPADVIIDPPLEDPSNRSRSRFGALAYREFRLLWSGLIISNTGSWMQYLAQGWLVVELASSARQGALYLGLVGLVRAAPVLLLSGFAGTLADRMDRRRILVIAQAVMGMSALILGLLVQFGVARIWEVMIVAAISAAGASFDAPTRQSLVPLIVEKRDLMNAIGLNSAAFNGPAIIGPAIAGVLVASIGIAPCFFINAASYVAVIVAIWMMTPKPPIADDHRPGVWHEMIAGVRYMHGSGAPFAILMLSTIFAIVARPYIQLLPAFAKGVIGGGPATLGYLGSAAGAGALCGSIATAFIGWRRHRGKLLLCCAAGSGLALAAFGSTHTLVAAATSLVLLGGFTMLFMGMANTLLQTYTRIEMRGRVMALYTMTFLGLMPLGTWVLGSAASLSSLPSTFIAAGCLIVAVAIAAAYRAVDLRRLD